MTEEPLLICTVGLPRSGKTTWARTQQHPIVSPDSIRLALHGQRYIQSAEPFVWAIAHTMVESLFLAGHKVVVLDATNGTRKRRNDWRSPNYRTAFKVIGTSVSVCLERAVAEGDTEIVPVIERMAAAWEMLGDLEGRWES